MKIYGFCQKSPYINPGDVQAVAITEDARIIASHISTNEKYARYDLGMSDDSTRKHDIYDASFPDGWECVWVAAKEIDDHADLRAALFLYNAGVMLAEWEETQ